MEKILCIRCKGKGVHQDKLDVDGGVITCALCEGRGYLDPVEKKQPLTKEERFNEMLAKFE